MSEESKKHRSDPVAHFMKWASYKGEYWWGDNLSDRIVYTQLTANDNWWRVLKVWQGLGLIYMINTPIIFIPSHKMFGATTRDIIHSRHPVSVMLTEHGEDISKDTWVFHNL